MCAPISAQVKGVKGMFGYAEIGPSFLDHGALNENMRSLEYDPFGQGYFVVGGGMKAYLKYFVLDTKITGFMTQKSGYINNQPLYADHTAILQYYKGAVQLGYQLPFFPKGHVVYPAAGIGGGLSVLAAREEAASLPIEYKAWGSFLDFSLNWEQLSPLARDEDSNSTQFHLLFGARLGYLYVLDGWNLSDFSPEGTLNMDPSGPYIRLTLGMGRVK